MTTVCNVHKFAILGSWCKLKDLYITNDFLGIGIVILNYAYWFSKTCFLSVPFARFSVDCAANLITYLLWIYINYREI